MTLDEAVNKATNTFKPSNIDVTTDEATIVAIEHNTWISTARFLVNCTNEITWFILSRSIRIIMDLAIK